MVSQSSKYLLWELTNLYWQQLQQLLLQLLLQTELLIKLFLQSATGIPISVILSLYDAGLVTEKVYEVIGKATNTLTLDLTYWVHTMTKNSHCSQSYSWRYFRCNPYKPFELHLWTNWRRTIEFETERVPSFWFTSTTSKMGDLTFKLKTLKQLLFWLTWKSLKLLFYIVGRYISPFLYLLFVDYYVTRNKTQYWWKSYQRKLQQCKTVSNHINSWRKQIYVS